MRMEETPEWMESWLQVPFYREKCKIHIGKHPTVYCGVCREEPACEACWNKHHSNNHQHHTPILKVCTASRRAAIEVNEMAKVWDVSGIQIYIINGKKIFHLNPKLDQVTKKAENDHHHHHQFCETCKKKITLSPHSPPNVAFCSIACKFKYNSIGAKNMQMGDDTNNNVASSSGIAAPPQNVEAAAKSTQLDDYKIGDVPTPPKNEERNDEVVVQTRRSRCCELILESCTSGGTAEKSSNNKSLRKRSRKGIPRRAPFQ